MLSRRQSFPLASMRCSPISKGSGSTPAWQNGETLEKKIKHSWHFHILHVIKQSVLSEFIHRSPQLTVKQVRVANTLPQLHQDVHQPSLVAMFISKGLWCQQMLLMKSYSHVNTRMCWDSHHRSHPDPSSEWLCSIFSAEPTCHGTSQALSFSAGRQPPPTWSDEAGRAPGHSGAHELQTKPENARCQWSFDWPIPEAVSMYLPCFLWISIGKLCNRYLLIWVIAPSEITIYPFTSTIQKILIITISLLKERPHIGKSHVLDTKANIHIIHAVCVECMQTCVHCVHLHVHKCAQRYYLHWGSQNDWLI